MEKNVFTILNPEHILFFYQLTTDEIHNVQKQKWSITYYSLLINAAILGIYMLFDTGTIRIFEQLTLMALSVIITFAGILYLVFTQKILVDYHIRLRRIYKNLPEDKYIILEKMNFNQASFGYQFSNVIVPYIFVLFFECVAVIYIMIR
jgi:uncharacterized membrane protein